MSQITINTTPARSAPYTLAAQLQQAKQVLRHLRATLQVGA